jgi:hypothetical protein
VQQFSATNCTSTAAIAIKPQVWLLLQAAAAAAVHGRASIGPLPIPPCVQKCASFPPNPCSPLPYLLCAGERACRRDPLKYNYTSITCLDMLQKGKCPRGNACQAAHSVSSLHTGRLQLTAAAAEPAPVLCMHGFHAEAVDCARS